MVLAVSVDQEPKLVPPYVRKHKLTFPHLLDPQRRAAGPFGQRLVPTNFIIDRKGRVVGGSIGYRNWASPVSFSLFEHLLREKELALRKGGRPKPETP